MTYAWALKPCAYSLDSKPYVFLEPSILNLNKPKTLNPKP